MAGKHGWRRKKGLICMKQRDVDVARAYLRCLPPHTARGIRSCRRRILHSHTHRQDTSHPVVPYNSTESDGPMRHLLYLGCLLCLCAPMAVSLYRFIFIYGDVYMYLWLFAMLVYINVPVAVCCGWGGGRRGRSRARTTSARTPTACPAHTTQTHYNSDR
jgi:hypothetical protein